MSTDQKYGEGASHANNVDSAVQNPEQTGENSPQTAISFEEILQTPGLSKSDKTLLEGLNSQGDYTLECLIKAAEYMAKTPGSLSPGDEVDGVSLRSILLEGMKQSTEAPAKFKLTKGEITFPFSMSVHSRGGNSQTDIIAFALDEYRADRLKKAFNDVRDGEFSNAYCNFSDAETASTVLFEMLLDAITLADKNYWVIQGEDPKTNSDRSGYDRFLREYLDIDPATQPLD